MEIAFDKTGGLVPAIIQDEATGDVLDARLHERRIV